MFLSKILLVSGLIAAFSVSASGFPVTVDNCGTPLIFDKPPRRAVIHDINMAEMAFALHLQPQIVGLTGISGWYKMPPDFQKNRGSIPELAPKYPSLETLMTVQPDFFFAGWNYGMRLGGDVTPDSLKKYNIKALILTESCIHVDKKRPRASMDLLYGDTEKLGKIFGKAEEAEQLISEWKSRLSYLKKKTDQHQAARVFVYDSGEDKPFTSGKYGMPTAIIEAAGGRNVMDNLEASWTTAGWESVAITEPDYIILVDYQVNGENSANNLQRFLENHPLMKLTPAVQHHRYIKLRYEELTPGPANIDAIQRLSSALYPDDFS
ncbi:ABC transporter substrate-binding protein [Salmonella enterica]|nr:ABC transporter substrate-binding protein [Salmonella enterica]